MIYVKVVGEWVEAGMNVILFGIDYNSAFKAITTTSLKRDLKQENLINI